MNEIFERVSIRKFTEQQVKREDIKRLLEAAMQAPSAGNQQPWEFIVIEDKATLRRLAQVSPYATPLVGASLGIVLLCNDKGLRFPECAEADLAAAAQNILLEAVSLGLGAVWLALADFVDRVEKTRRLFELPPNVRAFCAIAVGYPNEKKKAKSRYQEKRVHYEEY